MAISEFHVNDLVWAKMRSFPAWPGRISMGKRLRKDHQYVYFFGTHDHAWIPDKCIEMHTEKSVEKVPKRRMKAMDLAIVEIVAAAEEQKLSLTQNAQISDPFESFFQGTVRNLQEGKSNEASETKLNKETVHKSDINDKELKQPSLVSSNESKDLTSFTENVGAKLKTDRATVAQKSGERESSPKKHVKKNATKQDFSYSFSSDESEPSIVIKRKVEIKSKRGKITKKIVNRKFSSTKTQMKKNIQYRSPSPTSSSDEPGPSTSSNWRFRTSQRSEKYKDSYYPKLDSDSESSRDSYIRHCKELLSDTSEDSESPEETWQPIKSKPKKLKKSNLKEESLRKSTAKKTVLKEDDFDMHSIDKPGPSGLCKSGKKSKNVPKTNLKRSMKSHVDSDLKFTDKPGPSGLCQPKKKKIVPKVQGTPSFVQRKTKSREMFSQAIVASEDSLDAETYRLHGLSKSILNDLKSKSSVPSNTKLGFLGLGFIGSRIVTKFLEAGYTVNVWNRTKEKCTEFIEKGAKYYDSPAKIIIASDLTFCCVSDTEAARGILHDPESGVLKGFKEAVQDLSNPKGYAEITSIDPKSSQEFADAIHQEGGLYVEAALISPMNTGQISDFAFFIAGDVRLYHICCRVFSTCAGKVEFIDVNPGRAISLKLLGSTMTGLFTVSLAETISQVKGYKMTPNAFMGLFRDLPMTSTLLNHQAEKMMTGNFNMEMKLKHQMNDLKMLLDLSNELDQPLEITAFAHQTYMRAVRAGHANDDPTSVVRPMLAFEEVERSKVHPLLRMDSNIIKTHEISSEKKH